MKISLPTHARAIIIGGGVIGSSVAYHLARQGWRDILLLERDKLTSGTTWHAAGLIASAGMSDETLLWIQQYSRDLYKRLEAETGVGTGWREVGHLHLSGDATRAEVLRRDMNFARAMGVERHEVSPAEVAAKFPLIDVTGLHSAVYTPRDGRANPVDVTMSLAAGARAQGVRIVEGCPVLDITLRNARAVGVMTAQGPVSADVVILATGMWSRQIAARIGVPLAVQAAEHYYLLTEPVAGATRDLPIVEDPETFAYVREEAGGLLFGFFEDDGKVWQPGGIPETSSFAQLPPDWDRLTPFMERAFHRFPVMNTAGIKTFFCGPESFTPDGGFVVGHSPDVENLYLATGMNSLGVLSGGGVGALVAELVTTGAASQDITALDPARQPVHEATRAFLGARIPAALGYTFTHGPLPQYHPDTARGVRRLALHDRYVAMGAQMVPLSGWEMPQVFGAPVPHLFGRQPWFDDWKAEHTAVRQDVGLFDKSFMGKFLVQGRDALAVLNRISAAQIDVPMGRNVYTQWLNPAGGIVSDLTITRLAEDEFLLVTGDALQRTTRPWLMRNMPEGAGCTVADVTSAYAVFSLQGPRSRALLAEATGADLSDARLPYRASMMVELGMVPVRAVRITYAGELGYELYIPSECAHAAHDALLAAKDQGGPLVHCGLAALESLRLEKGFRDYGVDIDNTDNPQAAGLGFAVAWDKGDFIGRAALEAIKAQGVPDTRLVQVLLDRSDPMLLGHEPVFANGDCVGHLRSGSYGHALGASVGIATISHPGGVSAGWLADTAFEVLVNDTRVGAHLSLRALYDPDGARVRG
jgi:glycine cleavage system T protein